MLVHVTGQMGGQTLILLLGKVPATFTGQKLHRKIGLIFLYFSINLVFFWAEMSFCQGDHFFGFFKLVGAFAGFPATQKIPKSYSV